MQLAWWTGWRINNNEMHKWKRLPKKKASKHKVIINTVITITIFIKIIIIITTLIILTTIVIARCGSGCVPILQRSAGGEEAVRSWIQLHLRSALLGEILVKMHLKNVGWFLSRLLMVSLFSLATPSTGAQRESPTKGSMTIANSLRIRRYKHIHC